MLGTLHETQARCSATTERSRDISTCSFMIIDTDYNGMIGDANGAGKVNDV